MQIEELAVVSFETELGSMAAVARGDRLVLLKIGYASQPAALASVAEQLGDLPTREWKAEELVDRLRRYAAGEAVELDAIPLDLDHLTPFQQRVVRECRAIGYGETLSYGELAARAGSPRAARAVGGVMRANRFPLIVPCHRVIGAGGALGGFSAPDGVTFKQRLLTLEAAALAPA